MPAKKRRSPAQRAYSNLQKMKGKNCAGKATKTQVKDAAKKYIAAATKAGRTKADATKSANKITNKGCGVGSTPKKKKSTGRKRR